MDKGIEGKAKYASNLNPFKESLAFVAGQEMPEAVEGDLEIESKFRATVLPRSIATRINNGDFPYRVITQGYVRLVDKNGRDKKIRLRKIYKPDEPIEYEIAHKESDADGDRHEHELKLNSEKNEVDYYAFLALWNRIRPEVDGEPVKKVRFDLPPDVVESVTKKIELDVFLGREAGLIYVEPEFNTKQEKADFLPPEWFGESVTEDKRFSNTSISKRGIPENTQLAVVDLPVIEKIVAEATEAERIEQERRAKESLPM